MDWNAWVPVAMILAGALAAWLKNRSQDEHVDKLEGQLAELRHRVEECDEDRRRLNEMVRRGYDFPP